MSEIKVTVEQLTGACINKHILKTSGPNGGDNSIIDIEFTNISGAGVEYNETEKGFKITYVGDSEGESLVRALKEFVSVLEKEYKTEHSTSRVEISRN